MMIKNREKDLIEFQQNSFLLESVLSPVLYKVPNADIAEITCRKFMMIFVDLVAQVYGFT